MDLLRVTTIGFTKSSAAHFFGRLRAAGVRRVMDVRLHNTSQLAGFAKADDLAWFLKSLGGIDYVHEPLLAPTADILDAFKKRKGDWRLYERQFLDLMQSRRIETTLAPDAFDGTCLLCSEATPHHCHRRLVVDYLNAKWHGRLAVEHL
ncbi:uncharacterized protein (DUF488 family) [Constrictibacter sp. MBR-5]|jgi:uncharacterized protein (DUF488 family)|uniref:DUF488 domain-containing protein n=1 Tax=Constrictibacter sp. MBR-5 TaxID=3156467 RepID=UPI0033964C25